MVGINERGSIKILPQEVRSAGVRLENGFASLVSAIRTRPQALLHLSQLFSLLSLWLYLNTRMWHFNLCSELYALMPLWASCNMIRNPCAECGWMQRRKVAKSQRYKLCLFEHIICNNSSYDCTCHLCFCVAGVVLVVVVVVVVVAVVPRPASYHPCPVIRRVTSFWGLCSATIDASGTSSGGEGGNTAVAEFGAWSEAEQLGTESWANLKNVVPSAVMFDALFSWPSMAIEDILLIFWGVFSCCAVRFYDLKEFCEWPDLEEDSVGCR